MILWIPKPVSLSVGSLGTIKFNQGYYAYTGSARGAGGFKRVERHIRVSALANVRRWHIDYILPYSKIVDVVKSNGDECEIARRIGRSLTPIPNFGCSDCGCDSHLHYCADLDKLKRTVSNAHKV